MSQRGSSVLVVLLTMLVLGALGALLVARVWSSEREGIVGLALARARISAAAESERMLAGWRPPSAESLAVGAAREVGLTRSPPGLTTRDSLLRLGEDLYLLGVSSAQARADGGLIARAGLWRVVPVRRPVIPDSQAVRSAGPVTVDSSARVSGRDTVPVGWGSACEAPAGDAPGIVAAPSSPIIVTCPSGACVAGTPPETRDSTLAADFGEYLGGVSLDDLVAGATVRLHDPAAIPGPVDSGAVCLVSAATNLGDPVAGSACFDLVPLTVADSGLSIPGGLGQGVLIGRGPLVLEGDFAFFGVVVARGLILLRDRARVIGTVLAPAGIKLEGASEVRRSRCAVQRAVAGQRWPDRNPARGWIFRP